MSRLNDYEGEMLTSNLSDHDIERLLSGARLESDELAELAVFVDLIRLEGSSAPSERTIARVATEASVIARSARSPSAATSALPQRGWAGKRLRPQLAGAAVAVLLLFGATGVAVAADGAVPGDALYGIDLVLERVGIGAGGVEERLDEASELVARGRAREALDHAAEAFNDAEESGEDVSDLEEAKAALEAAAEKLLTTEAGGDDAMLLQENVGALIRYLKENLGKGVDIDGKDFGQGVSDLARGIGEDGAEPTQDPTEDKSKKTENVGGPPDSVPGDGNGNSDGAENSNSSGNSNGNGNGNGSGNSNGNGNGSGSGSGSGPPDGSPSETAPGQDNRP